MKKAFLQRKAHDFFRSIGDIHALHGFEVGFDAFGGQVPIVPKPEYPRTVFVSGLSKCPCQLPARGSVFRATGTCDKYGHNNSRKKSFL
jgi:hypothetical protein